MHAVTHTLSLSISNKGFATIPVPANTNSPSCHNSLPV